MKRGDVYVVRLDPIEGSEQAGTRPAVIVSHDGLNAQAPYVIGIPFTSRAPRRRRPGHVAIPAGEANLQRDSFALAEQMRCLSKRRLGRYIGTLSPETMAALERAMRITLGLS